MFEELRLGVNALRGPLLQGRIETRGRIHEERRAGAHDFITSPDAVNDCERHWLPFLASGPFFLLALSGSRFARPRHCRYYLFDGHLAGPPTPLICRPAR